MNYKVENNQVIFTDRVSAANRNRGRKLGSRLAAIVNVSKVTLSDIARIYAANRVTAQLTTKTVVNCAVTRAKLSHVLANRDNSPAYINAIESAWRLPIATIREYYQLDKTNPLATKQERKQFEQEFLEKYFPEKLKTQQEGMLIYNGLAA